MVFLGIVGSGSCFLYNLSQIGGSAGNAIRKSRILNWLIASAIIFIVLFCLAASIILIILLGLKYGILASAISTMIIIIFVVVRLSKLL